MAKVHSIEHIKEAAERGDPFAMFELAIAYEDGRGIAQDLAAAAVFYAKASSLGHTTASSNLWLLHVGGHAKIFPAEGVFKQFLALASKGETDAQNNAGICYQFGYGVKQDYKKAATWFRRAARAGLATAQFNLGGFYFEGTGVRKNSHKALGYYKQAAEQRDELALLKLGSMYQKGIVVSQDVRQAFILYLCAYRQGSVRAAIHLAILYKKGLGVERDDVTAHELFLEGVCGYDSPNNPEGPSYHSSAYYWLGLMSERGEGTASDIDTALDWYRKGAVLSEPACVKALARLVPRERKCKSIVKQSPIVPIP
jgi:hypothetical protein